MRGTFLALSPLNRKLLRDLWHARGQVLAIAMVIAAGVATLILALGAYSSLEETRRAYYERYRFADVFATAKRVPNYVADEIARIPGVADVETRAVSSVLLDIAGMAEPATGKLISIPETGGSSLNRVHIREGRLPEPLSTREIAVSESFAEAHGFRAGDRISAIINGRKRELIIVGVVLSPEFIYTIGPGDLVPDDRRTGVLWMRYAAAAAALDLEGAFNDVSVKLMSGAEPEAVMSRIDRLLEPYGGQDSYTRDDQLSHAFIDAELQQLGAMAYIIPPIFLAVSAFLLNMTLARLITLEREQIGLLKALGYPSREVGFYYIKFVSTVTVLGVAIGFAGGTWLGHELTQLYTEFFNFPFLVFLLPTNIYLIAAVVSFAAALLGTLQAVRGVVRLPPAVAMQPPPPTRYAKTWLSRSGLSRHVRQSTLMIGRHIIRFPVRSILTTTGIAASVALLIVSFYGMDSVDYVIDVTYSQTSRQDVSLSFNEIKDDRVRYDVANLPGVMRAEPYRTVPVTLRHGLNEERVGVIGMPPDAELTQLLDPAFRPMEVPDIGIVLSEMLADLLDVRRGDMLQVAFKTGRQREVLLPVTGISQAYLGLNAHMHLDLLNDLMGDGDVVSGANIKVDETKLPALYDAVKETPAVSSIALLNKSRQSFRDTLAENINTMTAMFIALSAIIAFGVVYNSVRIQLSERGRELASLRILGFTQGEVMLILFGEVIVLLLIAIPIGWVAGYILAGAVAAGMETELYRVPLIVDRDTYAKAALVAIVSTPASAGIMRGRSARMDRIAGLKTRA